MSGGRAVGLVHGHTSCCRLSRSFLPPPMARLRMMPVPAVGLSGLVGSAPFFSVSFTACSAFFDSHPAGAGRPGRAGPHALPCFPGPENFCGRPGGVAAVRNSGNFTGRARQPNTKPGGSGPAKRGHDTVKVPDCGPRNNRYSRYVSFRMHFEHAYGILDKNVHKHQPGRNPTFVAHPPQTQVPLWATSWNRLPRKQQGTAAGTCLQRNVWLALRLPVVTRHRGAEEEVERKRPSQGQPNGSRPPPPSAASSVRATCAKGRGIPEPMSNGLLHHEKALKRPSAITEKNSSG